MADFVIVQNDTDPPLQVELVRDDDTVQDLTGATATLRMDTPAHVPVILDAPCAIVNPATLGLVQYNWSALDTATPGVYEAEIHVTLPGGAKVTFPSTRPLQVWVRARLV